MLLQLFYLLLLNDFHHKPKNLSQSRTTVLQNLDYVTTKTQGTFPFVCVLNVLSAVCG